MKELFGENPKLFKQTNEMPSLNREDFLCLKILPIGHIFSDDQTCIDTVIE